jgi:hypothetical protein
VTWAELDELERHTMSLVAKRRSLGAFDANAADVGFLAEVSLKLLQHLKSTVKKPKDTPLVRDIT